MTVFLNVSIIHDRFLKFSSRYSAIRTFKIQTLDRGSVFVPTTGAIIDPKALFKSHLEGQPFCAGGVTP